MMLGFGFFAGLCLGLLLGYVAGWLVQRKGESAASTPPAATPSDANAAALAAQQRFVANASHELRTPLAVMRTEIDVTLADDAATTADFRRMGIVVRDASKRANELIDALLVLAGTQAQAGRLVRRIPVDLAVGAPAIVATVQADIDRLALEVRTSFVAAPVVGDPRLLERLVGNLVENAVRYNVAGGSLAVRTGTELVRGAPMAFLEVANSGPEVNSADVPELFEPFRRGGTARTGTRGAGLGLSIVRAVVEAHGGVLDAQPRRGGGLAVSVWLPVADLRPAAPIRARAAVPR